MKIIIFILWIVQILSAQYNFSAVDKLLQDSVNSISGLGGGYSLVLYKDGKIIYDKSFSVAGRTYTSDKIIPIASASKWLSAGVIMAMIDDGKYSLNDSAGKYISYLPGLKPRMTIRQLFSHTSGLGGDGDNDTLLIKKDITMDSCVRLIAQIPLMFQPGNGMYYGGYGMHIAGRISEIVSGVNMQSGIIWDTLFAQKITRPLGMNKTNYDAFGQTNNPRVSGGIQSSAVEYLEYLKMLLHKGSMNGQTILSENSVSEMLNDQTNNATIYYSPYMFYTNLGMDSQTRYGIGNWREVTDSFGNAVESSSQGKFGFSPWIDQKNNLAGVFSVLSDLTVIMPTYIELKKRIRSAIEPSTTVSKNDMLPAQISLEQNYPNPFNPTTNIRFQLLLSDAVSLKVYDVIGREVRTLVNEIKEAGSHLVEFNAGQLPAGMYLYTLRTGNSSVTKKLVLVK